jgi:uncharacterized membrane protein
MSYFLPGWMVLTCFAGPIVALALGLIGLKRRRKTALLLIGAALSQTCQLFAYRNFNDAAKFVESTFKMPIFEASQWASMGFSIAGVVPLVLLLWAVFCDRKPAPPASRFAEP